MKRKIIVLLLTGGFLIGAITVLVRSNSMKFIKTQAYNYLFGVESSFLFKSMIANIFSAVERKQTNANISKTESPSLLKNKIANKYPLLDDNTVGDWEKVNILRRWASENIIWGFGSTQIKHLIQGEEAPHIFALFQQNKGSVDCGGAGYALMKLYKMYGFEAYEYHYGSLEGWNHAVSLVKISHKGKNILAVEDAFFNTTYTYSDQSPIDFFDLLHLIKNNEESKIKLIKNDKQQHLSLCEKKDICPDVDQSVLIKKLDSTRSLYLSPTYFSEYESNLKSYLIPRILQIGVDKQSVTPMLNTIMGIVRSP